MRKILALLVVLMATYAAPTMTIRAQTRIVCGDIIEVEFNKRIHEINYSITLAPGDILWASGEAFGDALKFSIILKAPDGQEVAWSGFAQSPSLAQTQASARGNYTLMINNHRTYVTRDNNGGVGVATVSIGCTLRDGTIINPGDSIEPTQPSPAPTQPASLPQPPAFGFPGLAPVDFKDALELPFVEGQPIVAAIAGNAVFMSKLNATAGEVYVVTITRTAGNASLGLTVIDPNNAAVFNVAMGTMDTFTANIKIAMTGTYTLGFYNSPLAAGGENTAGAYTITVMKQ